MLNFFEVVQTTQYYASRNVLETFSISRRTFTFHDLKCDNYSKVQPQLESSKVKKRF